MKRIIIIAIFSMISLFLSGCFKSKGLSDSEVFEKKKECALLNDQMTEFIRNGTEYNRGDTVSLITYSKSLNTCVFGFRDSNSELFVVYDFFSKKLLNLSKYLDDNSSAKSEYAVESQLELERIFSRLEK